MLLSESGKLFAIKTQNQSEMLLASTSSWSLYQTQMVGLVVHNHRMFFYSTESYSLIVFDLLLVSMHQLLQKELAAETDYWMITSLMNCVFSPSETPVKTEKRQLTVTAVWIDTCTVDMLTLNISVWLLVLHSGSFTTQNDALLAGGKVFYMCSAEHQWCFTQAWSRKPV